LALVAANGRLAIFQPAIVSYLALAVLMWLLLVGPRWQRRWLLPVAILLLHVYWVNHDGWFILGPIVIAAWFLGSLVQSRGDEEPSARFWFGVLICSLIGCLINPHHVRAFTVPDDLVPTFF